MSPKFVHDKSLSKNSLSKGKGRVQRRGAIVELEEKSAKARDSERVLTSVPSSFGVGAGAAKNSAGSNVCTLNSSDRISSESVSPNRVIQRRGSVTALESLTAATVNTVRSLSKFDLQSVPGLNEAIHSKQVFTQVGAPDLDKLCAVQSCLQAKAQGATLEMAVSRIRWYFFFLFLFVVVVVFCIFLYFFSLLIAIACVYFCNYFFVCFDTFK